MVYLQSFTIKYKNQPNVGNYTIHSVVYLGLSIPVRTCLVLLGIISCFLVNIEMCWGGSSQPSKNGLQPSWKTQWLHMGTGCPNNKMLKHSHSLISFAMHHLESWTVEANDFSGCLWGWAMTEILKGKWLWSARRSTRNLSLSLSITYLSLAFFDSCVGQGVIYSQANQCSIWGNSITIIQSITILLHVSNVSYLVP